MPNSDSDLFGKLNHDSDDEVSIKSEKEEEIVESENIKEEIKEESDSDDSIISDDEGIGNKIKDKIKSLQHREEEEEADNSDLDVSSNAEDQGTEDEDDGNQDEDEEIKIKTKDEEEYTDDEQVENEVQEDFAKESHSDNNEPSDELPVAPETSDQTDVTKLEVEAKKKPKKKKNKKPKHRGVVVKTEEDIKLEKLIFGDKQTLIERLENQVDKRKKDEDDDQNESEKKKRKPAWHDSDDDEDVLKVGDVVVETKRTGPLNHLNKEKSYKNYLTRKFERIVSAPKWADLDREEEVDSDEEILKTVGHLAPAESTSLPPGRLSTKKLKDLNRATYSEGTITGIHFHPESTVAIVSGNHGLATVYSIDGLKNDKLHSMQFKNFPINCSRLLPNGREIIFGSNKNFCYSYDLIETSATRIFLPKVMTTLKSFEISPDSQYIAACGRFGEVHLLDMKNKELIHTFKQEAKCSAIKFSKDSNYIFAHSRSSNVSIFDIRQQKAKHIFFDDGCIKGTCLAFSPNSNLFATGSNEGVVNVYNYADVLASATPTPLKVIYNLKTSISDIKFNHTGEILGLCSKDVYDGLKMVHFPTATVFSNIPYPDSKLGQIGTIEFSPHSGFFAMGNYAGKVPLLRFKHYKNY